MASLSSDAEKMFLDSAMSESAQTPRQLRLHVVSFNGTWAGGVLSSRKTVVSEFVKLISDHENVFEIPLNGVGSDINLVDRVVGGICGWGTLRNVITAHQNLSKHYSLGDRIILTGYSRGAWAARYLAKIIELIGLPKDGCDQRFFHRLYKTCDNGSIFNTTVSKRLLEGYNCWPDVKIDALCCFDTVGSLGLPHTGLAKPLAILRLGRKKPQDVVSDVASNVRFSFHCLSLHETRGPYSATLMRGPRTHQIYFPGNHSDLGWIDDTESLVHAPFAWMIQQLHTHLHISFDEAKLAARFPSYRGSRAGGRPTRSNTVNSISDSSQDFGPRWCQGRIRHVGRGMLAIIGQKPRRPGRVVENSHNPSPSPVAGATNLRMHIGARLRTNLDGIWAVPGYTLMVPARGKLYWARQRGQSRSGWGTWGRGSQSWSGSDAESVRQNGNLRARGSWRDSWTADRIEEAEVGSLEARLLGLPEEVILPTRH